MIRYGESLVLIAIVIGAYDLLDITPTIASAIITDILGLLFITAGYLRERHASTGTR